MDMENGKQNSQKTTESRPDPAYYHSPSGSQGAVLQIMVQPQAKMPASRTRSVAGNSFLVQKS
jgi:hypothetical protein